VVVDSGASAKLNDKKAYDSAREGWYYGTGCFYGSDKVSTINIKVKKSSRPHVICITK